MWQPFANGATIGQTGSEGGVIVRDEEHGYGARATLERDGSIAPWSVTCGVYGWFFHTRFASSEAGAEFEAMLAGLADILESIPAMDDPDVDAKSRAAEDAIGRFVDRFP